MDKIINFIKYLFKERILMFLLGLVAGLFFGMFFLNNVALNIGKDNIITLPMFHMSYNVKKFPSTPLWHNKQYTFKELTNPRPGWLITTDNFKQYLFDIKKGYISYHYPNNPKLKPQIGDFVRYHVQSKNFFGIPAVTYLHSYRKLVKVNSNEK